MHSVATFTALERGARVRPEWRQVGSLRVALTLERAQEFARLARVAREAGLAVEEIDPAQAQRRFPADFSTAQAILWCPTDGYLRPAALAASYRSECERLGVRFVTGARVREIEIAQGRVAAVVTDSGRIACRYAVNAAGAHAYHVARLAGLELPIIPVRHEYFVSVAIDGLRPDLPCLRVPDLALYARADGRGLLLGGWEAASLSADPRRWSLADEPPVITPDSAVLDSFAERFGPFLPGLAGAAHSRVAKGWPTFTPDGRFIIGESSRVPGFVMAGGCNAHGISGSAGIGRLLVESLFSKQPSEYARSLSPDRFTEARWTWDEAAASARRVYETYYAIEGC
jgi:glycine/D-amino acid oxidase-like deaminating enzyme